MDAGGFALPLCLSTPTLAHSHSQDTQTHMCACVCSFVCSFTCLLGCFEQSKSSGVRRSSRMWRSTLTRFVGNNNMAAALALSLSLSLSLSPINFSPLWFASSSLPRCMPDCSNTNKRAHRTQMRSEASCFPLRVFHQKGRRSCARASPSRYESVCV